MKTLRLVIERYKFLPIELLWQMDQSDWSAEVNTNRYS